MVNFFRKKNNIRNTFKFEHNFEKAQQNVSNVYILNVTWCVSTLFSNRFSDLDFDTGL